MHSLCRLRRREARGSFEGWKSLCQPHHSTIPLQYYTHSCMRKAPIVPIVREGPDKGIATPAIIIPFRRSIGRLLSL